ncbi:polyprotein, partial [Sapovirus GV/HkKa2-1]
KPFQPNGCNPSFEVALLRSCYLRVPQRERFLPSHSVADIAHYYFHHCPQRGQLYVEPYFDSEGLLSKIFGTAGSSSLDSQAAFKELFHFDTEEQMPLSLEDLAKLQGELTSALETVNNPFVAKHGRAQVQSLLAQLNGLVPRDVSEKEKSRRAEFERQTAEAFAELPNDDTFTEDDWKPYWYAMWRRVTRGCKSYYHAIPKWTSFKTRMARATEPLRQVLAYAAQHFDNCLQLDPRIVAMNCVAALKPTVLMMIYQQHRNTPRGWLATLTALWEVFSPTFSHIEGFTATVTTMIGLVVNTLQKFFVKLCSRISGVHHPEGPTTTGWAVIVAGALALLMKLSCIPRVFSHWHTLLKLAGGITTVVGAGRAVDWVMSKVKEARHASMCKQFLSRVSALLEVHYSRTVTGVEENTELLKCFDQLVDEGEELVAELGGGSLSAIIRSGVETLQRVAAEVKSTIQLDNPRKVPVCVILCGPPGIGKTSLAYYLAKGYGKTSNFSLANDHHDGYTGNRVAIWDEFDTDRDGKFVEQMIALVNTQPCVLNCDRPENKGKLFTSDYIFCTTNYTTSVVPTNPRAGAFYRRVITVDVRAPEIEKWMEDHPGKTPPKNLFKADCSHLQLTLRPYLGYNPEGDTLPGKRVRPTPITIAGLHDLMDKRFEEQAGEVRGLWITVPNRQVQLALTAVKKFCIANQALCHVTSAPTPEVLQCATFSCVVVSHENPPPDMPLLHIKSAQLDVNSTGGSPSSLTTSLLGLFITDQKVSSTLQRQIMYRVWAPFTLLQTEPLNTQHLPPVRRIIYADTPLDFLAGLRHHLGFSSIPGLWRAIRHLPDSSTMLNWIVDHLSQVKFPENPESTLFRTANGDVIFYTFGSFYALGTCARVPAVTGDTMNPLPNIPTKMTWFETLRALCSSALRFFSTIAPFFLSIINLSYLTARGSLDEEGKGKTKQGRGARHQRGRATALNDDEYNEWMDLRRDWREDMTADQFLRLRDEAFEGIANDRTNRYAAWLNIRNMRIGAGAYEHATIIGKGGVRNEVIRTELLTAPKKGKWNRGADSNPFNYFDEAPTPLVEFTNDDCHVGWGVHLGNGRVVTVTHVATAATLADGVPFKIQDTDGETCFVVAPLGQRPHYQLGDGHPVYYTTRFHPVLVISEGQFDTPNTTVCGYHIRITNSYPTKKGDCGQPYFNAQRQVVGLHAAGSTDGSTKLVQRVKTVAEVGDHFTWKGLPVIRGTDVGGLPTGTRYHRSPAWSEICADETHAPAPFGAGDKRFDFSQVEMLVNNLRPYLDVTAGIPPALLNRAVVHVRSYLESIIGSDLSEPLSFGMAAALLEKSTSCGPHVAGLKGDYWDEEQCQYTGALRDHLEKIWNAALIGTPPPHDYKLALKDELRPIEKNLQGKRRLLWGADAGLTIVCCAALKPVAARLQSVVPMTPVSVGVNMDSAHIEIMNESLKGRVLYALDYSKWDSTQSAAVTAASLEILSSFMAPCPLVSSAVEALKAPARGMVNDVIFVTRNGLPSGMPFTSVVNSINHMLYICAAILQAYESRGLPYSDNVFNVETIHTYGDDCLYGFTPATASLAPAIIDNLKGYGLKPTAADKTDTIAPVHSPVFLKRTFAMTQHGLRALLDQTSIVRQFYWVKAQRSCDVFSPPTIDVRARAAQLEVALAYASQHGHDFFERVVAIARKTSQAEGYVLVNTNYEQATACYNSWFIGGSQPEVPTTNEGYGLLVFEMEGSRSQDGPLRPQATGPSQTTPSPPGTTGPSETALVPVNPEQPNLPAQRAELAIATGALASNVPECIRRCYALLRTVPWNTRQAQGTLLAAVSLHPNINPYTAHLSQMFAGWGGSMEVRVTISGSGLFAGKLICGILPPGIDPSGVTNPGVLPHALVDARLTDPAVFNLADVRAVDYHRTDGQESTVTLGIWVMQPLINPFGSAEVVSTAWVSIETMPGSDFDLCLLKPPEQRMDNGVTPDTLFPRRLHRQRGNRAGGYVVGAVIVGSASQINRHFNAAGTTLGWSTAAVEPMTFAIGEMRTGNNGSGQKIGWCAEVGADGRGPLYPNIVNQWPDFAINNTYPWPDNQLIPDNCVAGTVMHFQDNGDVSETEIARMVPLTMLTRPTQARGTIMATFNPATMYLARTDSVNSPNWATSGSNTGNGYFTPLWGHGNGNQVGDKICNMDGANYVFNSSGPNNILLWEERIFSDYPGKTILYSSQLEYTSVALQDQPVNIPDNMMAVYNVESNGASFQLGLRRDGYCVTGGTIGTHVNLDPETTFTFAGIFPLSASLIGPHGNAGRARIAWS